MDPQLNRHKKERMKPLLKSSFFPARKARKKLSHETRRIRINTQEMSFQQRPMMKTMKLWWRISMMTCLSTAKAIKKRRVGNCRMIEFTGNRSRQIWAKSQCTQKQNQSPTQRRRGNQISHLAVNTIKISDASNWLKLSLLMFWLILFQSQLY